MKKAPTKMMKKSPAKMKGGAKLMSKAKLAKISKRQKEEKLIKGVEKTRAKELARKTKPKPGGAKKSPMKKPLIGKQKNLPKELRDKILASPAKMLKPAAMKLMKKSPAKMMKKSPAKMMKKSAAKMKMKKK